MTLGEWLRIASDRLQGAGIDSPVLEAQLIASHLLVKDRSWVLAHPSESVDLSTQLVERRADGEPLPYLLGHQQFWTMDFLVEPGVLIPRPDTEVLVQLVLDSVHASAPTVVDVGSGSGAIAIALAKERARWKLVAVDIDSTPCRVTQQNAARNHVAVTIVRSDMLRCFGHHMVDAIVSNPPYVAPYDEVQDSVRRFEPAIALFGGRDGLEYYRRLAREADRVLRPRGQIYLEIGLGQLESVTAIFEDQGLVRTAVKNDYSGVPRALSFSLP